MDNQAKKIESILTEKQSGKSIQPCEPEYVGMFGLKIVPEDAVVLFQKEYTKVPQKSEQKMLN